MKKEQPEQDIILETSCAILYTDGSYITNGQDVSNTEGFYGSGVHGYVFPKSSLTKSTGDRPSKISITNMGYVYEGLEGEKTVSVVPSHYIDACYSFLNKGNSNTAEIKAMIYSLKDLLKLNLNLESVTIIADSQYALYILETILKDTNKNFKKDQSLNNRDLWLELSDVVDEYFDRYKHVDFTIYPVKVKGHSNDFGNELADKLAYFARRQSCCREINSIFHVTEMVKTKYWNIEDTRSPLLRFKQLFFTNTIRAKGHEVIYSILDYPTDVSPGTKTSNSLFGLVIPTVEQTEIEDTIKKYHALGWHTNKFNVISTCNLNNLYSRNNIHYHRILGPNIYKYNFRHNELENIFRTPIIHTVRPSGLAVQAMDHMQHLYSLVVNYKKFKDNKADPFTTIVNVTSDFYNFKKNRKGQEVYECKLPNGLNFMKLKIKVNNVDLIVPLDLGKDTPNRNIFKALEKDAPLVHLMLEKVSPEFIRYYTIIEVIDGTIGIYCNYYSGKIIL